MYFVYCENSRGAKKTRSCQKGRVSIKSGVGKGGSLLLVSWLATCVNVIVHRKNLHTHFLTSVAPPIFGVIDTQSAKIDVPLGN